MDCPDRKLKIHFPAMLRESSNVNLLYSLEQDGISIKTLYGKAQDQGPCLLSLKDTDGNIYGFEDDD